MTLTAQRPPPDTAPGAARNYRARMGVPVGDLLHKAAKGNRAAWDDLVDRFGGLVWAVARSFRLDAATASDVSQTTWLRLVENCDRIRDPERLPGWLATTARREALRAIKHRQRVLVTDEVPEPAAGREDLIDHMLESERQAAIHQAYRTLSEQCARLLRLLTLDPPLSYDEIAAVIDRPVGSLGPTRARCLEQMRRSLAAIETGSSGQEPGP